MITLEKTFEVNRPIEQLYVYASDPGNAGKWNNWILQATQRRDDSWA